MDTRGTDRRVAEMLLGQPYVGEVDDGRFHGFGRIQLIEAAGSGEYAGTFKHGRRHGSGTAVWPDGLKYIGQWHDNAATGVGCLSWPAGALYVGDVKRGQRHGFGVFRSGDCKYVGEWREGKRHGWGTQLTSEYTYSGQWVDGHRHGWGTAEFASLNRYAGDWAADKIHGRGTMLWVTLERGRDGGDMYRRSQRDLMANLRAKLHNVGSINPGPLGPFTPAVAASTDTLEQYSGDWVDDKPHGKGQYTLMFRANASHRDVPFESINEFNGTFNNGLRHGKGLQHFADGTTFEGTWQANLKHGDGVIHHADGHTEHVTMVNDCLTEASEPPPRGGQGVMAAIQVEDLLLEVDGNEEELATRREDLGRVVARASNTLHHLFNVYSSVANPVDFETVIEMTPEPVDLPPPPHDTYVKQHELRIPKSARAIERNAIIAAVVSNSVVTKATEAARRAFEVMKNCESQFEHAVKHSPSDFFSPNATIASAQQSLSTASPDRESTLQATLSDTDTPSRQMASAGLNSTRRPATPQVDTDTPTSLESLLPTAIGNEAKDVAQIRMTPMRLHAMLRDAQLIDVHFTHADLLRAIEPLRQRMRDRPSRQTSLSFANFVEAIIRISSARLGGSYPFFTADVMRGFGLCGRLDYVVFEFLWPLCAALRDMDNAAEFARLGLDKYVNVASEDGTIDEIRRAAVKVLREKARILKMKERPDESNTEHNLTVAAAEMDLNMTLGDTVADLTTMTAVPDAGIMRRIDRPSSASIDILESMDLPCGSSNQKITGAVRHKIILGAAEGSAALATVRSALAAPTAMPIPGATFGSHLEVWLMVFAIRHASVVHHRMHAAVVSVAADDKRSLVSVIPSAALHRLHLITGAPIPMDLRHYMRGAEGLRDDPAWAIVPHAPIFAHSLVRFEGIARVVESKLAAVQQLHAHCRGRPWVLVDSMVQAGIVGPLVAYSGQHEAEMTQLPADVLLRNVLLGALGTAVDSACSSVTHVDPCDAPPVYDAAILRAFLKKTPELGAALQIGALQRDQRRQLRESFKNLRTPVATSEWWSFAQELELSLEDFCVVLVTVAYFVYAAPPWRADRSSPVEPAENENGLSDDAMNAFETSSSISGATTATAKRGQIPPATVSVAMTGLVRAVEQFASCWSELCACPVRQEFMCPPSCFDHGDDDTVLCRPPPEAPVQQAAPQTPAAEALAPPPAAESPAPAKGKKSGGKNAPPPPKIPASVACLHPKARLARTMVPVGGLNDIPPVRPSERLPVRPRSTPVDDGKKKRAARK